MAGHIEGGKRLAHEARELRRLEPGAPARHGHRLHLLPQLGMRLAGVLFVAGLLAGAIFDVRVPG